MWTHSPDIMVTGDAAGTGHVTHPVYIIYLCNLNEYILYMTHNR